LPVSLLVRMMNPQAPPEILAAAKAIRFRGMVLIYLILEQDHLAKGGHCETEIFPDQHA
jgi:hypothetical protein